MGLVAVRAATKRVPVDRAVVELLALDVLALPVAVAALQPQRRRTEGEPSDAALEGLVSDKPLVIVAGDERLAKSGNAEAAP